MQTQLVAARTVAEARVDMATDTEAAGGGASAPFPEIAGPRAETLAGVAALVAARRGEAVRFEGVTDPADPDGEAYESGGLLPGPQATLAGPTFESWLDGEQRS